MSVAAAIRIGSGEEEVVIRHAAEFARRRGVPCYVISVVSELPYGAIAEAERGNVLRNLRLIAEVQASPVLQEGGDVAATLLAVARGFDVSTLFLQWGASRPLGRSIAKKLLDLNPPFDVVVVGSE